MNMHFSLSFKEGKTNSFLNQLFPILFCYLNLNHHNDITVLSKFIPACFFSSCSKTSFSLWFSYPQREHKGPPLKQAGPRSLSQGYSPLVDFNTLIHRVLKVVPDLQHHCKQRVRQQCQVQGPTLDLGNGGEQRRSRWVWCMLKFGMHGTNDSASQF